jgi:beta-1,4-N-acetylglucosaminyltransferase
MSLKHLEAFEQRVRSLSSSTGSYDICVVNRARRVHQSLLTTPFTAIMSILQILPALLRGPQKPPHPSLSLPSVIITNGPATGFFVGLVAYILRILYIVPDHQMRILFVESWARIRTLSLTGKLYHYTGIADLFLVQHRKVAARYGVANSGWLVTSPRDTGEVASPIPTR